MMEEPSEAGGTSSERPSPSSERGDASLVEAVERLLQAGLDVIERRVDLAQLEMKALLSRSLMGGLLGLIALGLLLCAWVAAMGAAGLALRPHLGDLGALAALALTNLLLGAGAGWSALRIAAGLREG